MSLRTLAFVALLPLAAFGENSPEGRLEGHALPDTQIVVIGQSGQLVGTMSDAQGHFVVEHLPPGPYRIAVKGDVDHARGAPVLAGRTTTIDLTRP